MKPLLPLAVLLAVMIAGCGKTEPKPDPYAKYRDVQLKRGMGIGYIKQVFGEPDTFDEWWSETPDDDRTYARTFSRRRDSEHPHHVEELNYGAFGAHSQKSGHITRHRLKMTFVNDRLCTWYKSTPGDRE